MKTLPGSPTSSLMDVPRGVWILGFVSLLMDVSSEMIHALLPIYLVAVLGVSPLAVGVIEGSAEATAAVTKVFSGAISDRLGHRKWLAAGGYGLAALTKPVFPLAPDISWLVAARFVDRLGKGIRGAPRDALIADLSPPDVRGASFGLRQSLDTTGAFLGPLLAIALMYLTANAFQTVFWIAVIPAFLAFLLIVLAVREPRPAQPQRPGRLPLLSRGELIRLGRPFWLVVAIATAFTLARFSEAFLLLRAQSVGVSAALVPGVLVVMNVVYALSAYPVGALSDRIGRVALLAAGLLVLAVADVLLAFAESISTLTAAVALWGLHMGMTQGLLATLVADTAPGDLRGTAFGLLNLVTGLTLLAASAIAGGLWDWIGPGATFTAGAAFSLVAMLALIAVRRRIGSNDAGPHSPTP